MVLWQEGVVRHCYHCMQVDVGEQGRLQVDAAAARLALAQSQAAMLAEAFPDWCSIVASEVFQFSWHRS